MADPNLNCLPIETIDSICRYLQSICCDRYYDSNVERFAATKGLAGPCRTSKRLSTVARPYLYHRVNLNRQEVDVVSFASSLLRNQHLADLVHEIDIEQRFDIAPDETLERYILTHPVTIKPVGREGDARWGIESPKWWVEKILEVLFFRLRKLRSITLLAHEYHFNFEVLAFIIDKHQHDLAFLHGFKEIAIRGNYIDGSENIFNTIITLMSSTHIQRLEIWDCIYIVAPASCKSLSLLEMRVTNSALEIDDFFQIVESFPNLQLLFYEVSDGMSSAYETVLPSTYHVLEAIAPLNKTPRTLILTSQREHNPQIAIFDPITHLSKLQNLVVGLHDMGIDTADHGGEDSEYADEPETQPLGLFLEKLPKSLQRLCVIDAKGYHLDEELLEMSKTVSDDLPNLESVVVDAPLDLQADFADTGIEYLEVDHHSLMYGGIGLEDYARECWQQMEQDRKNCD